MTVLLKIWVLISGNWAVVRQEIAPFASVTNPKVYSEALLFI